MSEVVETIKIESELSAGNPHGFIIINKTDFDGEIHTLFVEREKTAEEIAALEAELAAIKRIAADESNIPRDAKGLRTDGPTIEEWVAANYLAEHYPPEGYAENPPKNIGWSAAGSAPPPPA